MTTTINSNRQTERATEAAVQLTDQERKLVDQIDEQQAKRQAGRSKFVARILSTPLFAL